jgi:4,5-DOPA dioxygenase extradiol
MSEQTRPGRRGFLIAGGAALAGLAGARMMGMAQDDGAAATEAKTPVLAQMPAGFVAHGAPTLAVDAARGAPLGEWARAMQRPRAILVISAHWEEAPLTLGTFEHEELMYDFYGFPRELYAIQYRAPGAAELAGRVEALLGGPGVVRRAAQRRMDHGVWVPLLHMYPQADIPVLQVSMPSRQGPAALVEIGRKLAPLADEGVLVLGSGNLVHNLRRIDFTETSPPPTWAAEFDAWVAERIMAQDLDALVDFMARAPAPLLAHPNPDHYLPLLVVAGLAAQRSMAPRFELEGFEYGSISRRSVRFG